MNLCISCASVTDVLRLYVQQVICVCICVYMPVCAPQSTVSVIKWVLSFPHKKIQSWSLCLPCLSSWFIHVWGRMLHNALDQKIHNILAHLSPLHSYSTVIMLGSCSIMAFLFLFLFFFHYGSSEAACPGYTLLKRIIQVMLSPSCICITLGGLTDKLKRA